MLLGKLLVAGRPTNLDYTKQGPTALALGASGGCLEVFFFRHLFLTSFSLSGRRPDTD